MKNDAQSQQIGKGTKIFAIVLLILVLIPTFWRVFMHDFPILSIISLTVMDVSISALLIFILAVNPLKYVYIYSGLYLAFMASYLYTYMPADFWEWFGTMVVFLFLWYFVFPRLHTLTPYVIVGLFISYIFVIRIMILEMDYEEAKRNLEKQIPHIVAAEAMHQICGYGNRYSLAGERVHWYIYREDGNYMTTLGKMKSLAKNFYNESEAKGFDYLKLNDLTAVQIPSKTDSTEMVVRLSGKTLGSPKEAEGLEMVDVMVEPFEVVLKKSTDGLWRMKQAPDSIVFQAIKNIN